MVSSFQVITAKSSSKTALGDDGHREGAAASPSTVFWASLCGEGCGNPRLGLLSGLTGLQEGGKLWQIKVHGRVFMEWLLHGEDFRALPFHRV